MRAGDEGCMAARMMHIFRQWLVFLELFLCRVLGLSVFHGAA